MSDTFVTLTGTAAFDVQAPGRARASGAQVTVQKMPWSDTSVIWLGGKSPRTLSLSLYVASPAQMESLEALVGSFGTLTSAEGTFSAVLESASSGEYLPSGGQMVSAKFVVTT